MECNQELYVTIASSVVLLIVEQVLAASKCKSNSLTQLISNLFKCDKLSEENLSALTNGVT